MTGPEEVQWAMQPRCVLCLGEQFGPAVVRFSAGIVPCGRCGRVTQPMAPEEYTTALAATRARVAAKVAVKVANRAHAQGFDRRGRSNGV